MLVAAVQRTDPFGMLVRTQSPSVVGAPAPLLLPQKNCVKHSDGDAMVAARAGDDDLSGA
jgi:hypothetical protein